MSCSLGDKYLTTCVGGYSMTDVMDTVRINSKISFPTEKLFVAENANSLPIFTVSDLSGIKDWSLINED